MTSIGTHFMDREDHTLQSRLSAYLRRQYQSDHACRLARDINCDPRTAKNILGGHWPRADHLQGIVRRFGRDVRDALFEADINPVLARLTAEERELEERLEAARAHRRQVQGVDQGDAQRLAAAARGVAPRLRRGRP